MSGLPALLIEQATKMPAKTALRSHQLGIWEPTTWAQLLSHSATAGMGLVAAGAKAGDVVAIIAANHASSIAAELGAQGIGLVTLLIDPATPGPVVADLLKTRNATIAVVGDEEQHDKLIENGAAATLNKLVVMETRGLRHLDDAEASTDAVVIAYSRLRRLGEERSGEWASVAGARPAGDPAAIIAGTLHTNHDLETAARRAATELALTPRDSTLAVMAFAEPTGHAMLGAALAAGFPVQLSKTSSQAVRDLRVVRPTVLVAPDWLLVAIKRDADGRARNTKGLRKAAYVAGMRRRAAAPQGGAGAKPVPPLMLMVGALVALAFVVYSAFSVNANPIVRVIVPFAVIAAIAVGLALSGLLTARPLRSRYGFSAARAVLTPLDGLNTDVRSWFEAVGVPLRPDNMLRDISVDHDAVSGRGR